MRPQWTLTRRQRQVRNPKVKFQKKTAWKDPNIVTGQNVTAILYAFLYYWKEAVVTMLFSKIEMSIKEGTA